MSTPNKYPGYCCRCGADVAEGAGIIRRYSGANKRSAPSGSKVRSVHGHGYSDNGPAALGKYALSCIPCDTADQLAKKAAAKAERAFNKAYKVYSDALWALHADYDRATQATCAARDSGDAKAWSAACKVQDAARAVWQAYRVNEPKR